VLPSLVGEDVIAAIRRVAQRCPPGCFVEVGVYKGGTAQHLLKVAKEQDRQLFAYDTFTGIPYRDEIDSHRVGDFGDTDYETVKAALDGATVIKGVFPESAVDMPPVAFVHLDCDQYQSIRDACEFLEPRMVPEGVIWFDDYKCLDGATKAVEERYAGRLQFVRGKAFVVL
jgi:O-methyltransferase